MLARHFRKSLLARSLLGLGSPAPARGEARAYCLKGFTFRVRVSLRPIELRSRTMGLLYSDCVAFQGRGCLSKTSTISLRMEDGNLARKKSRGTCNYIKRSSRKGQPRSEIIRCKKRTAKTAARILAGPGPNDSSKTTVHRPQQEC